MNFFQNPCNFWIYSLVIFFNGHLRSLLKIHVKYHTKCQVYKSAKTQRECLSPLFLFYFWSNYDGPRTKSIKKKQFFFFLSMASALNQRCHFPGVSWIQHGYPAVPYGSPNLSDKIDFWVFLCFSLKFSSFFPKIVQFFRYFLQRLFHHYNNECTFWWYVNHVRLNIMP